MGKSSSNDELTIRNQFDRICKLALKGEAADYYRHIAYRQKHISYRFNNDERIIKIVVRFSLKYLGSNI